MTATPVRVLLVDDHHVVRKGLCALLRTETDIEVVGEAASGAEAVTEAERLRPDVVLMDLVMPGMDGVEATIQILARHPSAHVLVLTSFGTDARLFPAVKAGALGYLLKDTSPDDLVRAIRQAAQGQSSLNPTIARRLLRELAGAPETAPVEPLTAREIEVLRHLAHGCSNEEIATRLDVSEPTVRTHVSNVLAKLKVRNRTQAALYALRTGIASLDER